ncbi:hypothetical protein O988_05149, partial [Pseudogymnoascus sp. VKM F-3808]
MDKLLAKRYFNSRPSNVADKDGGDKDNEDDEDNKDDEDDKDYVSKTVYSGSYVGREGVRLEDNAELGDEQSRAYGDN